MKKHSTEGFLGNLRKIVILNYMTYICVNGSYSKFIYRFVEVINTIVPVKRTRFKTNSKPQFDNQIRSATQRRHKLYKKFKFRLF